MPTRKRTATPTSPTRRRAITPTPAAQPHNGHLGLLLVDADGTVLGSQHLDRHDLNRATTNSVNAEGRAWAILRDLTKGQQL